MNFLFRDPHPRLQSRHIVAAGADVFEDQFAGEIPDNVERPAEIPADPLRIEMPGRDGRRIGLDGKNITPPPPLRRNGADPPRDCRKFCGDF